VAPSAHAPTSLRAERVAAAVRLMEGRPYDANYQWDSKRVYCSELIA